MKQKHGEVPFVQHLQELQLRLMFITAALLGGGLIGYAFQKQLVQLIVHPLGSKLYYSNPAGGFSFLFNVCLLAAVIVAIPAIVFNVMRFMMPALPAKARFSIPAHLLVSVLLACAGILFAYIWSLPAALHFLGTFSGTDVQPLLFASDYLNFVITYLISFAVLFQLPVIINIIDKISPLKPGGMMKFERYIVLISFILAAAITPTPDPLNQLIMATPVILLYQVSVIRVWHIHKKRTKLAMLHKPAPVRQLPTAELFDARTPEALPSQEAKLEQTASVTTPAAPLQQSSNMSRMSVDGVFRPNVAQRPIRRENMQQPARSAMRARFIDDVMPMPRQNATA